MQFAEIILGQTSGGAPGRRSLVIEPLAHWDYDRELEVKNQALRELWSQQRLPLTPPPIVPSPKPRHYRTTTKRHVLCERGKVVDLVPSHGDAPDRLAGADPSRLEPVEHAALYAALGERLRQPHNRPLAAALNFVIIRGSYVERTVVFNVCRLDGTIVRKLKLLGQALPELDAAVVSAFVFVDPSRSPYYLDSAPVPGGLKLKKLFGPEALRVAFAGHRYLYYPTGFTQVNESMVPLLLTAARDLLAPSPRQHLLDLYCGYGLFTHFLAGSYAHACGLDAAPESIAAAERNARFHAPTQRVTFRVARLDSNACLRLLPRADEHAEVILADPPRQGLPPTLIAALAQRSPERVLEACCGIDEVPAQVRAWQAAGYPLTAVLPLDMFAGTPHLEVLLRFEPHGRLGPQAKA